MKMFKKDNYSKCEESGKISRVPVKMKKNFIVTAVVFLATVICALRACIVEKPRNISEILQDEAYKILDSEDYTTYEGRMTVPTTGNEEDVSEDIAFQHPEIYDNNSDLSDPYDFDVANTQSNISYKNKQMDCGLKNNTGFLLLLSDDESEDTDRLHLHPYYDDGTGNKYSVSRYGIYMTTGDPGWIYGDSYKREPWYSIGEYDREYVSYIIPDRIYEDAVPYTVDYYWISKASEPEELKKNYIHFRVVDLKTYEIIATLECDVILHNNVFSLENLHSTASTPRNGAGKELQSIVSTALNFAINDIGGNITFTDEEKSYAFDNAIVDGFEHTYFPQFYDTEYKLISEMSFADGDKYIVNLPLASFGNLTVYVQRDMNSKFEVIAFDIPHPEMRSSIWEKGI